ncbi:MAG: ImmA/IrrE family metallo-endopeptidase [Desulfotomaculales bacterium]
MGIKVTLAPFRNLNGMAVSLGKDKYILINENLTEMEQQFVAGHELGHFCLHPSTNFVFILQKTFFHSKHEYQANRFACELMLGKEAKKYRQILAELCARGKIKEIAGFLESVIEKT